ENLNGFVALARPFQHVGLQPNGGQVRLRILAQQLDQRVNRLDRVVVTARVDQGFGVFKDQRRSRHAAMKSVATVVVVTVGWVFGIFTLNVFGVFGRGVLDADGFFIDVERFLRAANVEQRLGQQVGVLRRFRVDVVS